MVFMPPGHAKSTYVSQLFPPWFMASHPRARVIGASNTAELAEHFSAKVQGFVREHAGRLGMGLASEARTLWETTNRGTYRAAGVGGTVTGFRADLFLIDDPIKGRKEADSALVRNTVWDWYRSEVMTRLRPGARIVLVLTRWHPDDLAGRLLEAAAVGADQWRVISLPALAEPGDEMGRPVGTALWPAYEDEAALERKRIAVGPREWAALFQQQPRTPEGLLFQVETILAVEPPAATPAAPPRYLDAGVPNVAGFAYAEPQQPTVVRAWDIAATEQVGGRDPDWTVGVRLARTPAGRFCIEDVVRFRGTPGEVERRLVETARADGPGVPVCIPQDPGAAGKAMVAYLTAKLAGFRVRSSPETGSKETRAGPLASQVEIGNVEMHRATWNAVLIDEMRDFPGGRKDDQVDALSRAFNELTVTPNRRAAVTINHMRR